MKLVDVLEKLSNACGVAGREDEVRDLMKELLKPNVDEIREDKLGNVIGVKKGKKDATTVMLAAHMDEIGLMVKNITKEGFLQFAKIGGIDDRILIAQKVLVHTDKRSITGIIGSKPPHILKEEEKKKVIEADDLFIDVGAKDKQDAQKMGVRVGDAVSFDIKFTRVGKDTVVGKAFDDRVGCAALIETMRQLSKVDCTIYVVGTIQEEVGLRGATTAAFQLYPDVGIALDVTVAGDVPGVKEVEAPAKMRAGPALTVADAGLITHPKVLRLFIDSAEENKIPYQLETGMRGTTDAAKIALTKEGVPSGVISIPTRYIHSPASLLSLKDVENAVKLAVATVKNVSKYF
ncbi:MAG: M42 family metallopeptidase [Candidatus Bathyarchaeota archaeon]|nr:M42 family metallopeptidase [Candidatus Bathyarchaeota archaeon]MDH5663878.1 M42 family metallopeptidase [Candidatus Bathyarchaeota archaeon]